MPLCSEKLETIRRTVNSSDRQASIDGASLGAAAAQ